MISLKRSGGPHSPRLAIMNVFMFVLNVVTLKKDFTYLLIFKHYKRVRVSLLDVMRQSANLIINSITVSV